MRARKYQIEYSVKFIRFFIYMYIKSSMICLICLSWKNFYCRLDLIFKRAQLLHPFSPIHCIRSEVSLLAS